MKPTVGRIVHFVQPRPVGYGGGEKIHLPAMVVAVWTDTCVNLQVFTDGSNSEPGFSSNPPSVKWITSAMYSGDADPGLYTWHWPERE